MISAKLHLSDVPSYIILCLRMRLTAVQTSVLQNKLLAKKTSFKISGLFLNFWNSICSVTLPKSQPTEFCNFFLFLISYSFFYNSRAHRFIDTSCPKLGSLTQSKYWPTRCGRHEVGRSLYRVIRWQLIGDRSIGEGRSWSMIVDTMDSC